MVDVGKVKKMPWLPVLDWKCFRDWFVGKRLPPLFQPGVSSAMEAASLLADARAPVTLYLCLQRRMAG